MSPALQEYDIGHIKYALTTAREALQRAGSNSTLPYLDYALKLIALRTPKFEPMPNSFYEQIAAYGCD